MPIFGEHQQTSITVKVNQLAKPHHNDDIDELIELYLGDLLHLIRIQPASGSVECARAIRKRIKYGDLAEEQLRALQILELLVLNAGPKIGGVVASDDKLVDLLKGVLLGNARTALGAAYDPQVTKRVRQLAVGWRSELDGLEGYKPLAALWRSVPSARATRKHQRSASQNVFESELDAAADAVPTPPTPPPPPRVSRRTKPSTAGGAPRRRRRHHRGSTRYADPEYRIPQINYKLEAPKIRSVIAECHTHTTALGNLLLSLAGRMPADDERCNREFEECRRIRRKVLRYLQYVGAGDPETKSAAVVAMDEEFLGSLIHANEQLVDIFKRFDAANGYTEANPAPEYDDSSESYYTSELEEEEPALDEALAQVTLRTPPPRPLKPAALAPAKPALTRLATNDTVGSDPFGDEKRP
jgi:hypothetical protein